MDSLKMQSPNLVDANIEKIAALFPNCITEDRDENGTVRRVVDFDLLRQELSASLVEGPRERYTLNWPGKNEAILIANAPIAKTLRPYKEESVDFENTRNIYIEGDNLDALKLLQETYLNKVKMIYIDPPYNTGNDFIYDDDFAEDIESFLIRSIQEDEEGNRLIANTETNGRFHSDWMTMMYSRLKLARNLLRDDGVIFISIDDNESNNLAKICNEIFGSANCLGCITVISNLKGRSDDKYFATAHNYLLAYQKGSFQTNGVPLPDEYLDDYPETDKNGHKYRLLGLRKRGSSARRQDRPKMFYPIYTSPQGGAISLTKENAFSIEIYPKLSDGSDGRWRWGIESVKTRSDELLAKPVGPDGRLDVFQIDYAHSEDGVKRIKPKTVWSGPAFANEAGTLEVKKIFNANLFDYPKPIGLIDYCLEQATSKSNNDLILDFFSGSSTTAHAVMKLNAKDDGNRKFIMVQLPELCDESSEAFKSGYRTLAEIGKERIRRAGKIVNEEAGGKAEKLDIGFRVLKVDTSNMKDVYYTPDQLKQDNLELFKDHIKPDRSPEDLLFQVFIDWGLDLTLPISKETIDSKAVYFVDSNALVACFDSGINEELVKKLAAHKPLRAVFRDDAFGSDSVKINVEQIFKSLSPVTEVKSI
jgi:adenine-specific DNA-methyltransferase